MAFTDVVKIVDIIDDAMVLIVDDLDAGVQFIGPLYVRHYVAPLSLWFKDVLKKFSSDFLKGELLVDYLAVLVKKMTFFKIIKIATEIVINVYSVVFEIKKMIVMSKRTTVPDCIGKSVR